MPSEYILAYLTDCPQTCINKLRAAVECGKYYTFNNIVTTLTPFQVSNTIAEHFYTNFVDVASSRSMTIPCNIIKCHIIKPTAKDWKEAYAADVDTN